MARIKARVQVHLPHDENGVSALPGQVIEVDTDNPSVMGYLTKGLLVPLDPLKFPEELRPPMATVPPPDGEAGTDGGPMREAGVVAPATDTGGETDGDAAESREEAALQAANASEGAAEKPKKGARAS